MTRTPEVEKLIARGRHVLDVDISYPASAVLVELAKRGARDDTKSGSLLVRPATGKVITAEAVVEALLDD